MTSYTSFLATVERWPDAVALEVAGRRITYADLHAQAETLAARLLDRDGSPPSAVGVLASRSVAAYVGYLAALRVRAVVVPLNPTFPVERTDRVVRAASVDVLVVDPAGADVARDLAERDDAPRAVLGEGPADPGPALLPGLAVRDDDVAYVLFTSGSTGRPKGVPIRHRHVEPYLRRCVARYGSEPGARFSQMFDLTFDPSVFDLFVAWRGGGAVVVPAPAELLAPVRFVAEHEITHWFSVPSAVSLARRMRMLAPGSMPTLRWSLFAGEALTLEQARAWAAAAPASVLENLYGPTELTITCTAYRLPADPGTWPSTVNGTVPIGRVHPGHEVTVRDEDGSPSDVGELWVRGPQRFDGYVDAADDVDRLVVAGNGPRWYRTGDRVCALDGELVHLGRTDAQVKVRGFRVELAEVEHALRGHDAVEDVVVVAGGDASELHAYYTGPDGLGEELVARARAVLPAYMVPATVTRLEVLPVTANGKLDRRALAAAATDRRAGPGPARAGGDPGESVRAVAASTSRGRA
ncbi:amino acid adenylation domain-containing protein [Cellulomonas wangsupingiae]|uniref:Amino acid adenylation domain-containing protein n=1 Tax=Cellulomonas wangsupingiae TaxID=2968085 RepID=A0ABY5K8I8_9CELL|nr:amino acid adenylation domain-containing protein [Cellulomonas wangsupingiae]MCC2333050.1 amino acid adenylation domain-containing protein [Cellulomonas wangsupingiae]UUI66766.1 amino acid adenylation domain-containing protein [Cellulomonas wangsupingiae]